MDKTILILSLILFPLQEIFAQQYPLFFNDRIIIKYESQEKLMEKNIASIQETQDLVENFLTEYGLQQVKPFWNSTFENQLQNIFRDKKKTIQAVDITNDLKRIFEYKYTSKGDPLVLARKISKLPGIEYAEPRFIRQTTIIPNDPFKNPYETVHKFHEAWEITQGSSDVIIGIVDSGVNYNHLDLKNKAWVNEDEIPDNGIDDDDNGYVDDYLGWDFWESGGFNSIPVTQDNDPFAAHSDHGTHVAGIATAEVNNSIGISGTGYNSRFMAIKAGGIEDDPNTPDSDESRFVGYGYEGILYGVLNGADIINNSWGGPGLSNAAQDVIDFAINADVVIVAAQGNDSSQELFGPASADGVLSVGSITPATKISSFSNYGYTVDVFAVGSSVNSTAGFDKTTFSEKSGTSMASPVVAGLAGLVKAQHPDWSPRRILHQIRATSVPFDTEIDPILLGKGMIDAESAVSNLMPGISIRSFDIKDSEGKSLSVGEEGVIELNLRNFGEATSTLIVSLESLQENITITSQPINIGKIETDKDQIVELKFNIPENYDLNISPTFIIRFADAFHNYNDYGIIQFDNLGFGVMNGNNISMSFSANGTIGVSDPSTASGGIGFIPKGLPNMLYEGGIIMSASNNKLLGTKYQQSNNVRGIGSSAYDNDFDPVEPFTVDYLSENIPALGTGKFSPNEFGDLQGVEVQLNTYAFNEQEIQNVIYTQYVITNISDNIIEDFYFGIFTDWDMDSESFNRNAVSFDTDNNFMYVYDTSSGSINPFISVDPMQGASSYLAIDNNFEGSENAYRFAVNDGFTSAEKINSLKAGTNKVSVGPADISSVVASGPYTVSSGVSVKLGFLYAYGLDQEELAGNIIAARNKFVFDVDEPGIYTSSDLKNDIPKFTKLIQNYPNPFNPSTELNYELSKTAFTELSIYNILGQKVSTLVNEIKLAGRHTLNFNATNLNSGIYFAVLKSGDFYQSIKMTLIK